jgi:hypothetical protein
MSDWDGIDLVYDAVWTSDKRVEYLFLTKLRYTYDPEHDVILWTASNVSDKLYDTLEGFPHTLYVERPINDRIIVRFHNVDDAVYFKLKGGLVRVMYS